VTMTAPFCSAGCSSGRSPLAVTTISSGSGVRPRVPRSAANPAAVIDADDTVPYEAVRLLVADLSNLLPGEEPTVRVVPMQADEFTCGRCFLIHPRSRLARSEHGRPVCRDCD
jgi:hypothetical protein